MKKNTFKKNLALGCLTLLMLSSKLGNAQYLASSSYDGTIKIWNSATGEFIRTLDARRGIDSSRSLAYSPHGKYLALGFGKAYSVGKVKIWNMSNEDPKKWTEIRTLTGHAEYISSVAFSLDGKYLVFYSQSGDGDGKMKIWYISDINSEKWKEVKVIDTTGFSDIIAFSFNGKYLTYGSYREIKVWNISSKNPEKWKEIRTLTGYKDSIWSMVFSLNDKYLVSAGRSGVVKIWNTSDRDPKRWGLFKILADHVTKYGVNFVHAVGFSLDSRYLVFGLYNKTIQIWNLDTGELIRILKIKGFNDIYYDNGVGSLSFSSDGKHLAIGFFNYIVEIWSVFDKDPKKWKKLSDPFQNPTLQFFPMSRQPTICHHD